MTASETQAAVPAPKSGTRGSRAIRLRGVSWFGLLLCVAVVLGLGWKTTPAVGESDDRVYSVGSQMKCLKWNRQCSRRPLYMGKANRWK